ncbi:MAG: 3-oxoacyl-ACP reductase family protein [Candidatus Latescibacterota bacterium]
MRLTDQVAVVTGAGSGIGKAIALGMAKEGADIVIADLNEKTGAGVAEEVAALGRKSLFIRTDVGRESDVVKMVGEAIARFGSIDILVNNAGIILSKKMIDTTVAEWDKILTNNLRSCFLCTREVAKTMIENKVRGKIVNISSIHARISEPNACAYTAAKGGMEAFARTCATELAPHKIRVNTIEPGATYTELTVPMYTESVKDSLYQRIPLKEIAQPEWIARMAVVLASDDSRYMTGEVITVDGGYVMDGSLPGAAYWEE